MVLRWDDAKILEKDGKRDIYKIKNKKEVFFREEKIIKENKMIT